MDVSESTEMIRRSLAAVFLSLVAATYASAQAPNASASQAEQDQIKIFQLQNSPGEDALSVLTQILEDSDANRPPSNPYGNIAATPRIKMAVHKSTNSLIVRGPASTLAIAESILKRLDEAGRGNTDPSTVAELRNRIDKLENLYRRLATHHQGDKSTAASRSTTTAEPKPRSNPKAVDGSKAKTTLRTAGATRGPKGDSPSESSAAPLNTRSVSSANRLQGTRIAAPSLAGKPMQVKRIAKPGTKVKKGDVLVELNVVGLEDLVEQQTIQLEKYRSRLRELEAETAAAEAEGNMVAAELEQRLGLAELDLTTYRKRTAEIRIKELESEVATVQAAVDKLEEHSKNLDKVPDELRDKLTAAHRALELARLKHSTMVEIEVPAQITRLEGDRKLAELALKLVNDKLTVERRKLAAEKAAVSISIKLLEDKIARLTKAKLGTVIKAPHDGFIHPRSDLLGIRPGTVVRENQSLMILTPPDNPK
jgi:multidrug resistance efflux pump